MTRRPAYSKLTDATAAELKYYSARSSDSTITADDLYDRILDIVYNGYPNNASDIYTTSGLSEVDSDGHIFRWATQCAIWHYTDNADLSDFSDDAGISTLFSRTYTWSGAWYYTYYDELTAFEKAYNLLIGDSLTAHPSTYSLDLYVHQNTRVQNLLTTRAATSTTVESSDTVDVTLTKTWYSSGTEIPSTDDFVSYVHLYRQTQTTTGSLSDAEEITDATETCTENSDGTYTVTFSDLPRYNTDDDTSYYYTVVESAITDFYGYGVVSSGTNTYTAVNVSETEVSITKLWVDGNNADGYRPSADDYVSWLQLTANDEVVDATPTVTDNGNNTYTVTYSDLPDYDENGDALDYAIDEVIPDEMSDYYSKTVSDGTITNQAVTSISVTKEWADGASGDEAVIVLLLNGEDTGLSVTLNEDNDWTASFTDVPLYDLNGNSYSYSVSEQTSNYRYTIEKQDDGSYVITNYPKTTTTTTTTTSVRKVVNTSDK